MKACVDLPSSLDAVSDRTWLIWGMTGEEIANRLTLFPYYARYAHHKLAAQCLDALRSDNGVGVHPRFGLTSSRVRPPQFLRYCKACRERDLLRHGETYWRRSHQLAGVLMCPEHGEQLVDSDALLRPTEFGGFVDATQSTADIARTNGDGLGKLDAINALKIANRCRDIFLGPVPAWPWEHKPLAYRLAVLERGFSGAVTSLHLAKFETAFAEFYGESLLSKLGCGIQLGKDTNWIRGFFALALVKDRFTRFNMRWCKFFSRACPSMRREKSLSAWGPGNARIPMPCTRNSSPLSGHQYGFGHPANSWPPRSAVAGFVSRFRARAIPTPNCRS